MISVLSFFFVISLTHWYLLCIRNNAVYLLEGNIGAGKSTLLAILKKNLPHIAHKEEPVDTWHGTPEQQGLLEHFYQDQQRWGFTMESFTLISRIHELLKHKNDAAYHQPFISERSFYSGFYCFAYLGYKSNMLSPLEWQLYEELFTFLLKRNPFTPQGFIYLATDPQVCHTRINKRNRSGESEIPLSYLQALHERHEAFLIDEKNTNPLLSHVPVLYIDGSEEFENNSQKIDAVCRQVETFIAQTYTHQQFRPVQASSIISD